LRDNGIKFEKSEISISLEFDANETDFATGAKK
jgi:hypothetical protein